MNVLSSTEHHSNADYRLKNIIFFLFRTPEIHCVKLDRNCVPQSNTKYQRKNNTQPEEEDEKISQKHVVRLQIHISRLSWCHDCQEIVQYKVRNYISCSFAYSNYFSGRKLTVQKWIFCNYLTMWSLRVRNWWFGAVYDCFLLISIFQQSDETKGLRASYEYSLN